MLRFIDIGTQTQLFSDTGEDREFCFYDTVTDRFVEVAGEQVWHTWDELEESVRLSRIRIDLQRLRSLCPSWVFNKLGP